jgi:hypothetical protein
MRKHEMHTMALARNLSVPPAVSGSVIERKNPAVSAGDNDRIDGLELHEEI